MAIKAFGKKLIISSLSKIGVDVNKVSFSKVRPIANYEPWKEDQHFMQLYNKINRNTLVDRYRCYELWMLLKEVSNLEGDILEVGVWRGGTGALIAKRAHELNLNCMVYLCDTFTGVVKCDENDSIYRGGEHSDTSVETVEKLLSDFGLNNAKIVVGIFPDDHFDTFKQKKYRFCHIDVDVYQSARDIFSFVWDNLVQGGIVVFDDYGFKVCDGVTKFVNELRGQNDKVIIHNLNGHAIVVKR